MLKHIFSSSLSMTLFCSLSWAQELHDTTDLEKKLANPVADLTTLPIQMNFNNYSDRDNLSTSVLNIQPAFSGKIGNSNIITRFILPIINTPADSSGTTSVSGFGDLIYQGFYAPGDANAGFVWAVGVLAQLPTGSDVRISSGKWGLGPALALIAQSDKLTWGGVLYQNWSVAGNEERDDVNLLTIQPLVSYRLGGGWSLNPFNNITRDENAEGSEKWNVPLGMSFSKLLIRKSVPVNTTVGIFGNVVRPDNAPDWGMKFQMNFVF